MKQQKPVFATPLDAALFALHDRYRLAAIDAGERGAQEAEEVAGRRRDAIAGIIGARKTLAAREEARRARAFRFPQRD